MGRFWHRSRLCIPRSPIHTRIEFKNSCVQEFVNSFTQAFTLAWIIAINQSSRTSFHLARTT